MSAVTRNRSATMDPALAGLMAQVEYAVDKQSAGTLSRRSFLKLAGVLGGGLTLAIGLGPGVFAFEDKPALFGLTAFVRISPEGAIYIYAVNPEIGQGVKTALPMIIAEELDAAWGDVIVEQSPIDPVYGPQFAGGSMSIPLAWDPLRQAGATARAMLVAAAAEQWGIGAAELRTEDSKVFHPDGRSLGYGQLTEAASGMAVPADVKLKERSAYRLLGQRVPGVDNAALVTGKPLFGSDLRLPGMLYATYVRCPQVGGTVKSANLEEVKQQPGVRDAFALEPKGTYNDLVGGVAIVGDSTWSVFEARKKLRVEWDTSNATTMSW